MGRFALVESGTVTNVIEADADFAASIGAISAESASIGDLYADGSFSRGSEPAPEITPAMVDVERDRRIAAGFDFEGVNYQSRTADWEVYSGKALEAFIAISSGAQPGDLRWSDPDSDFAWIATDNSRVPMDAQTVIELAKAASAHRTRLTFACSDIKSLDPIPADYADDKWWQ